MNLPHQEAAFDVTYVLNTLCHRLTRSSQALQTEAAIKEITVYPSSSCPAVVMKLITVWPTHAFGKLPLDLLFLTRV